MKLEEPLTRMLFISNQKLYATGSIHISENKNANKESDVLLKCALL